VFEMNRSKLVWNTFLGAARNRNFEALDFSCELSLDLSTANSSEIASVLRLLLCEFRAELPFRVLDEAEKLGGVLLAVTPWLSRPRPGVRHGRPFQSFHLIGNIYCVGATGVSAFLIVTPQVPFFWAVQSILQRLPTDSLSLKPQGSLLLTATVETFPGLGERRD
jgi:hypothetical protein